MSRRPVSSCIMASLLGVGRRLRRAKFGAGRPLSSMAGVVAVGMDRRPDATPSEKERPSNWKSEADCVVICLVWSIAAVRHPSGR